MRYKPAYIALYFALAVGSSNVVDATQQPFVYTGDEEPFYEFKWPIRKVAVIGAGVGYVFPLVFLQIAVAKPTVPHI